VGLGAHRIDDVRDSQCQIGVKVGCHRAQPVVCLGDIGMLGSGAEDGSQGLGDEGPSEVLRRGDDGVNVHAGDREGRVTAANLVQKEGLADAAQTEQRRMSTNRPREQPKDVVEGRNLGRAIDEQRLDR
jgi:hypothetical protein